MGDLSQTYEREELSGKTVLITGGAGFIGSQLAKVLVGSNEVRVLDDLSNGCKSAIPDPATFFEGDIFDLDLLSRAMAGVDIVFHHAALVSVESSVENPVRSHSINVDATMEVLEQARLENARVVFASSAAVYGHPKTIPIAETDPKRPTSPYGISKLAADHYVRAYALLYDVPTIVLRYFNVYGPRQQNSGDRGVVNGFLDQAYANQPLSVQGDGTQTRDFVHISDVIKANVKAGTTDHIGTAVNIGTGTSVSIRQLAELVLEESESAAPIVHTNARTGDIHHSRADISNARNILGFKPTVDIREGIADMVATHRMSTSGRV